MTSVTLHGHEFDADAVVNLMDDELREELHTARDWTGEQEFLDAYVVAHLARFGADFIVN